MGTTTQVFAGNAAIPYAAFNLRDHYYSEMARFVIGSAKARLGGGLGAVVDLGAGIGISTMEVLKDPTVSRVVAVEPEEGMRYFCELNTMGDPRVQVLEGRGEDFRERITTFSWPDTNPVPAVVDAVLCCQVFHLFNPPGKESVVPTVLAQAAQVLRPGGVLAFDLGPSNYEFALRWSDHRSGKVNPGEIMTELAHPLYRMAHGFTYETAQREFPDFSRENLWPPAAARMDFEFLKRACEGAGFRDLEVHEDLLPVVGHRVVHFIRGGWAVFFRWGPLAELPSERKVALMSQTMNALFDVKDFADLCNVMSYHPTAVFTVVKV